MRLLAPLVFLGLPLLVFQTALLVFLPDGLRAFRGLGRLFAILLGAFFELRGMCLVPILAFEFRRFALDAQNRALRFLARLAGIVHATGEQQLVATKQLGINLGFVRLGTHQLRAVAQFDRLGTQVLPLRGGGCGRVSRQGRGDQRHCAANRDEVFHACL